MEITDQLIRQSLLRLSQFASERFNHAMIEARRSFDTLIPIPPADDTEMRTRLIMFTHWFLMDNNVESGATPADIFFKENLLKLSYQEEAIYRALRISRVSIYSVSKKQNQYTAIDLSDGEHFRFKMNEEFRLPSENEVMTMRFINVGQEAFLSGIYATHHYSTRSFIQTQLIRINPFDRIAFSRKVFELTALSIKSKKYNWVEPIKIYEGVTKL
ncbi:MAG: hypothetical protein ACP5JP_00225 [bacterium]